LLILDFRFKISDLAGKDKHEAFVLSELGLKSKICNPKSKISYSLTFVNLNISYDHKQAGTYIR